MDLNLDLDKYLHEYSHVSRSELERFRDCASSLLGFEWGVKSLHMAREKEKNHGKRALDPGPLIHVISVSIQSVKDTEKPVVIYGNVHVEFSDSVYEGVIRHDIYKRERSFPEVLDTDGCLTLNGPDYYCLPSHAFMPMFRSKINVELFDGNDDVFARESFSLDDKNEGVYEQVTSKCISCEQGFITVKYIAIPLAVYCRIQVMFHNRKASRKCDFLKVNGKITAHCVDTYGNYDSEESVLFQKQVDEYEKVEIDRVNMKLSRYWVSLPAYSAIVVGVDLSEYETGRKIVNGFVKLEAQAGLMYGDSFVLDDLFIEVSVSWFSPSPLRPLEENYICQPHKSRTNVFVSLSPTPQGSYEKGNYLDLEHQCSPRSEEPTEEMEEMDMESEEEYENESSSDDEPSICWGIHSHKSKPWPYPAVEIFSVFIGRKELKDIHIHGSIEILSYNTKICCIFKRDEDDPLHLSKDMNIIPISDGSRVYEDCNPLDMKFNLSSVDGSLIIKGYVEYDASVLEGSFYRDKQLCSFIQGKNGFAVIHYSIFSKAVRAHVTVFMNFKMERADSCPNVYGCLVSEYRFFDYFSSYNKDHYTSLLFKKTQDDPAQLSIDGSIPLSRSSVVVPSYSPLIINVNLSSEISMQMLDTVEIGIGEGRKVIETNDCILRIEVDWCEIK